MSASQTNNVNYLAVGADVALSSGNMSTLNEGEIGLFDKDGTRLLASNATTATKFVIARGGANSKPSFVSDVITKSDVKSVSLKATVAEVLESQYIGSNGTSGSIEAIDNNLYMISVYVEDYLTSSNDGRYIKQFQYKSDSSATQSEIALGLAGSAYFNWSREAKNAAGDPFMVFKAVCDNAGAALSATTGTITAVKGSKIVLAATDADGEMAVNDFWRAGTGVTDPVYKVVSISAAQEITLDRPFEGTTQVFGATATEYITAALGAAANWGINMSGTTKDHSVGKEFYNLVRFNASASDFGSTTIQSKTAGVKSMGGVKDLKDLEWFLKGFEGEIYRVGQTVYDYTTAVTEVCDILTITFQNSAVVGFTENISPKQLTIAIPNAATPAYADGGTNDIDVVLELLLAGVPAYTIANSYDGTALTTGDLAM